MYNYMFTIARNENSTKTIIVFIGIVLQIYNFILRRMNVLRMNWKWYQMNSVYLSSLLYLQLCATKLPSLS